MTLAASHPPRWLRPARAAWLVFAVLVILMYAAGALIYFDQLRRVCTAPPATCAQYDYPTPLGVTQLAAVGLSLDTYALLRAGYRVVSALVPIALGLLIFARKPDEPFALFLSLFLVVFGMAGEPLTVLGEAVPALFPITKLVEYLGVIALPLFFGLFPNGRMVPRLYWLVVVYFAGMYIGGEVLRWDLLKNSLSNFIAYSAWLSVLLGGVAAQVYRYLRVSKPEEKRQTRWVLFGMALTALLLIITLVFTNAVGDNTIGTTSDPDLVRRLVFLLALNNLFQIIYLSIGVAILRSRLFDIDLIIRRTVTYALVTGALLLVFFGSVVLLQQLFAGVTGSASNELITVLSTLAIAALFVPLRNRIQGWIDRRFNRRRYDAQRVLTEFGRTVRDETDLENLTGHLLEVVDKTMQPRAASIWLRGPQKDKG